MLTKPQNAVLCKYERKLAMCILTEVMLRSKEMDSEDMQDLLLDLYKIMDIVHKQSSLSLTEDMLSTTIGWLEDKIEDVRREEGYARENARMPK